MWGHTHTEAVLETAADIRRAADQRLVSGRIAGVLFSVGCLAAIPTVQILHDPSPPAAINLVIALGIVSGLVCWLVPWGAIAPAWLHAIPVVATLEVALGVRVVGVHGDVYSPFFVFVAVFAGYAFTDRRAIAAHVSFACVAYALPLAWLGSAGGATAARTLTGIPLLIVIAAIVTLLREGLVARQRELEELTRRDPLTGVGNYRLLTDRLDYELARHARSGAPLTVMLLDLDGFKEINDSFGHLVGDRVLVEVARALKATVRSQDTLARHGGDEFSILAPETDDAAAERLAARVRTAVATIADGSLTTSAGWVTYPEAAHDRPTLLALADAQLRRNKQERAADRRELEPAARRGILRLVETGGGRVSAERFGAARPERA